MSEDRSPSSEKTVDARGRPRRTVVASATDDRFEVPLRGVEVGPETRCAHYHGPQDVIAIRFPCCDMFYPCHACHRACMSHEAERWPIDQFAVPAVLCGACRTVLTIAEYLDAEHTCPSCGVAFNPGCARHHARYFEAR